MGDLAVATGDIVMFEPTFGNRTLIAPAQAQLRVTPVCVRVGGKPAYRISDLAPIMVPGVSYVSGAFSIPGMGMIQLVMAAPDQTAKKVFIGGVPMLIKGNTCLAMFIPTAPATNPLWGIPDPTVGVPTPGKGRFIVTQFKVQAA
ncbi:hypothetical protein [Burkholderia stagnalis]|uniref:Type VI secretion protein n=1 Tax=Burkholderia stagnalis TaxID=1503054 RepID=A0ABX9YES4_9BURK|nr:hypothetical protein [Burkholderia stagnalis]RQQ47908.1 hypothetical protein DF158_33410 [Burkholderia stagnalis]RQQ59566.1 hypothetical protein DF137_33400 [Burkholderia stagnalis]RQQ60020.1 hypothetical protein DF139_33355 [Burkholderia stagnalis]RQQ74676.1 hypothetical protein DF138_32785 [Burkholderia stagnalis]RQQ80259.1 hypothetical protein DF134_33500 [Burkholderia stagnalis]